MEFLKACGKNFWSFIIISLIISLTILILAILIIVIPVLIVSQSAVLSEGAVFKTAIISGSVFIFVLALFLIVADYTRAWIVAHDKNTCFKALAYGLKVTFRTFFPSYSLMLILLTFKLLFGWFVFSLLSVIRPATGVGIVLLFIMSQFLFFIKIMLKAWRFGSITRLMELNT